MIKNCFCKHFLFILFYNTHRLNVTSLSFNFHHNFCCLFHLDFDGETATEKSGEVDERGEEERQNPGDTKICNVTAYEFSENIALGKTSIEKKRFLSGIARIT